MLSFVLAILAWAVIPFDSGWVLADINVALLFVFAASSLEVYGVIMGGWASNSKYAFLGSLRTAAQMISYEVSLGLIIIGIIISTGSMNFSAIVAEQDTGYGLLSWYGLPHLPMVVLFFISALAETNRPRFDLPEAESELVAGFMVEYSSTPYLLFMAGEYIAILLVGGGASLWMALALAMIVATSRGQPATAALIGLVALAGSFVVYRASAVGEAELHALRRRFDSGAPLSLVEARHLLDAAEREAGLSDALLRRLLTQLHPSIGELIPVRVSPLPHGEGCRWVTYWQGTSGWALVAICREPGSVTPIHAHPHRRIGKAIEGVLEELRFSEEAPGVLVLTSRSVLGHNDLVETDGLATIHVVRVEGPRPAIDLQLGGPEVGRPGRLLRTQTPLDLHSLRPGAKISVLEAVDERPGHGGEGAGAGRRPDVSWQAPGV